MCNSQKSFLIILMWMHLQLLNIALNKFLISSIWTQIQLTNNKTLNYVNSLKNWDHYNIFELNLYTFYKRGY